MDFGKIFEESEKTDFTMFKSINSFNRVLHGLYRPSADFRAILMDSITDPDVIMYIKNAVKHGISRKEILRENFTADKSKTYIFLPEKQEYGILAEMFPGIKINESFKIHKDAEEIPADRSLGSVSFYGVDLDPKTKKERIERIKEIASLMDSKPVPNVVYVSLTRDQALKILDARTIQNEVIGFDLAVTYDMDKHILAVVESEEFVPLASYMVENDSYPEQLFTDEFEEWCSHLTNMWISTDVSTDKILYFIDLWSDSIWYEGFLRKWNRMGGGGVALNSIENEVPIVLKSTEQDEFFGENVYRLDPGNYNSPLVNIRDNLTVIPETTPGNLITIINNRTNLAYLTYNGPSAGPQTYYRVFRSQPDRPKSNAYVFIGGFSQKIELEHLTNGLLKIELKLPGVTGWMDCLKLYEERNFSGQDGQGIMMSYDRLGQSILELTFAQFSTGNSQLQGIMRITYMNEHVPRIGRISMLNWRNLYSGNQN